MRLYPVVLVIGMALAGPSFAQQSSPPASGAHENIGQLPPPSRPSASDNEHCVEVEIGGEKTYNCLNDKLKGQVERVVPIPNIPPVDSSSADHKIGIINMPAVKQQYGKNFGKSVVPYRPAKP